VTFRVLFVLATLLPYVIAAEFVRDMRGGAAPTDRRRFEGMVLGTGGLYALLHVLTFTGLLSVPALAAAGGVAALVVLKSLRARVSDDANVTPAISADAPSAARGDRWMEWLSTLGVAAVCALWLVRSAGSLDVVGTDAAHYHVPHAVNYALGASPWGPMPTPHGYPMGTSLLIAWFILPFGDAFIIDASMIAWYLVLVASIAALFRSLTGLSGWSWTPWLALVLFGMPLIRESAYPSADLPYAASFVAVTAQLVWMVSQRAFSLRDWVVLGASLGLLVGCKASGVYSAALLGTAAAAGHVVARRAVFGPRLRPWAVTLTAVSVACLVTGGIWLVRSAWLFGWPVEAYADRYHLSVLQDVKTVYGGDWFYLLWRTDVKISRLLGPHFLLAGAAIVWLCLESALRIARRRSDAIDRVRLWVVGLLGLVAVVHAAGLVGAPWTSLEWTDGRSLRYVLPIWILYAVVAYVGLFSRVFQWHRHAALRAGVWLVMGGIAVGVALGSAEPGGLALGGDGWPALILIASTYAAYLVFAAGHASRPRAPARLAWTAAGVAIAMAAAGAGSAWLSGRHEGLRSAADREESDTLRAWMSASQPAAEPHRQVYLDVRADEMRHERTCGSRRFFVASRFDLPLALQPAEFTSQVFDSRQVELTLPLVRQAPGPGTCDYAVVDQQEAQRPAIRLASAWLHPVETTGRFLIYEIRRPGAERRGAFR
jgi:hypothetical protein